MRSIRQHEMRNPDPYRASGKTREPAHCPTCGAVTHHGHWQWPDTVTTAGAAIMCPACRRVADANPAGTVHISGPFAREHLAEIVALCWHEAHHEERNHPLHRIMAVEDADEGLTIATTDTHLPERIGHALHRAFKGKVGFHHGGDARVRVEWQR